MRYFDDVSGDLKCDFRLPVLSADDLRAILKGLRHAILVSFKKVKGVFASMAFKK